MAQAIAWGFVGLGGSLLFRNTILAAIICTTVAAALSIVFRLPLAALWRASGRLPVEALKAAVAVEAVLAVAGGIILYRLLRYGRSMRRVTADDE